MASRVGIALVICVGIASTAAAQVVRFETSVGSFDMVLNPTDNPLLDGHTENMLQYVENGNYNGSWINRAPEGFVLQMGGFFSHTLRPPQTLASTRPVATFGGVPGEPAVETQLSNTVGTVALALRGHPTIPQRSDQDSGTSSFFINLGDNSSLDVDFTVFAAIPDMTAVNEIMGLMQEDLAADPSFGVAANNATFMDVPVQANGFQVFIKRAFEVADIMSVMKAVGDVQSVIEQSAASAAAQPIMAPQSRSSAGGGSSLPQLGSAAVPEPATTLMASAGLVAYALFATGRRRKSELRS